ncbi:hypothetical protein CH63R_14639 [Colletotrichum higginsianum IMI 349063]|uniref:Uncharacterized protein n=1 Tax=Colletotrichum higginsianum (strain IMI 349063) TaxID=759273 RepID=A0A1B7XQN2_COLHI|nr:hypothetical protein CH63R_14639 [Colletotrichum higginsianum IMI 349063]OBR02067.1 hypothetical protein CH63R_14639 [Colletotrichum higginsianum IMI 349063]
MRIVAEEKSEHHPLSSPSPPFFKSSAGTWKADLVTAPPQGSIHQLATQHRLQMMQEKAKKGGVDQRLRGRQLWRFRQHLLETDPASEKLAAMETADPGLAFLDYLGWDTASPDEHEEKLLPSWDGEGLGRFGTWINGTFSKTWRRDWEKQGRPKRSATEEDPGPQDPLSSYVTGEGGSTAIGSGTGGGDDAVQHDGGLVTATCRTGGDGGGEEDAEGSRSKPPCHPPMDATPSPSSGACKRPLPITRLQTQTQSQGLEKPSQHPTNAHLSRNLRDLSISSPLVRHPDEDGQWLRYDAAECGARAQLLEDDGLFPPGLRPGVSGWSQDRLVRWTQEQQQEQEGQSTATTNHVLGLAQEEACPPPKHRNVPGVLGREAGGPYRSADVTGWSAGRLQNFYEFYRTVYRAGDKK